MASLKMLLGIFPNTENYEKNRDSIRQELESLLEFEKSSDLKRYLELKDIVNSESFKKDKAELLKLRYKGSKEFNKEKEYIKLSKNKKIKLYLQTIDSPNFKNFTKVDGSDKLKNFNELNATVDSEKFKSLKKFYAQSAKKKFHASDLFKTLQQYSELAKSFDIRSYKKFVSNKNYTVYSEFIKSGKAEKLAEYLKLVDSSDFKKKKSELKRTEFEKTPEGIQYKEYQHMLKTSEYKAYKKQHSSSLLKSYQNLKGTPELEAFLELEKFINSEDFSRQKKEIENKTFKDTEDYKVQTEFEKLRSSKEISDYIKFSKSKEYKNYKEVDVSDQLKRHKILKTEIESKEFAERKKYLQLSGKQRWLESDSCKLLDEFEKLAGSEKIKWYLRVKDSNKFDWFRKRIVQFEDDFSAKSLDSKKWLTRYYWGEKVLQDSYALDHEKHYFSDGKNLKFTGKTLEIVTKKESVSGKAWHPEMGFIPRDFDYTAGLINSSKGHWQKFGTVEAKIKFNSDQNILNAFWMVSEKMLPHIDIAKADRKLQFGNNWQEGENFGSFSKGLNRGKFAGKFFIYSVDWTPSSLTWYINGQAVATSTKGVPQEPMYVSLSTGVYKELNGKHLPASMEIDWIRCYQDSEIKK